MNGKCHYGSLLTPLFLMIGIIAAMRLAHPIPISEAQAGPESACIAPQLKSPRFAPVWAITLHNQYQVTQSYRTALRTASSPMARLALEQRYAKVAAEYNRMAREAPSLAFQTLPQPRVLPE